MKSNFSLHTFFINVKIVSANIWALFLSCIFHISSKLDVDMSVEKIGNWFHKPYNCIVLQNVDGHVKGVCDFHVVTAKASSLFSLTWPLLPRRISNTSLTRFENLMMWNALSAKQLCLNFIIPARCFLMKKKNRWCGRELRCCQFFTPFMCFHFADVESSFSFNFHNSSKNIFSFDSSYVNKRLITQLLLFETETNHGRREEIASEK